MNKSKNTTRILSAVFAAALAASAFPFASESASALSVTRSAAIVSANYYDDTLQLQYRIMSQNTETTSYEYALRYSGSEEDFQGESVSDEVPSVALAASEEYNTVSVEIGNAENVGSVFYTVECKATTDGESAYTYTAVREAEKTDLTDTDQAYLVDCGSNTRYAYYDTSEAGFTAYQSSTWQDFGEDPLTGKQWGIVSSYDFTQTSSVSASRRTLLGSALNAQGETMSFRFEVEDDVTAYTVVMGFQDQNSSRINSAGDIFVNGSETPSAGYVGAYNAKIVSFTDVVAAGDEESGYFIDLEIVRTEESRDNPLCNFISIRKKDAEQDFFLGAAYTQLNLVDGTAVSDLPAELEIYTTAGAETAPVDWSEVSESKLNLDGRTYYDTSVDATVEYNGKTFTVPVDINLWTKEDVYYFVDCAQTLPFSSSVEKFEWLKNNKTTLLNTQALDQESDGSTDWGWFGIAPTVYWGNIDSYASIYEGTDYNLYYNFPGLPVGTYTFEVGITDPWGPRTTRIFINGKQADYFETKTGQKAQKAVTFSVEKDGDPVFIRLSGSNSKPLAGWMMISAADVSAVGPEDSASESSGNGGCGSSLGIVSVLSGLTAIGVAAAISHGKRRK